MLARISTAFDCTAEQLWAEISRPASLRFVAAPLLHFEPLVAGDLDGEWVVGETYAVRLSLCRIKGSLPRVPPLDKLV